MTYGQLWKETQNVAFAIGKWKISRKPIIVLSERDRRCITLFWGILYSGNFYVPLNYKDNQAVFENILNEIEPYAVFSLDENQKVMALCKSKNIQYCTFWKLVIQESDIPNMKISVSTDDPAYMVFTSGSTGIPKGVIKTHRSIVSFVNSFSEIFSFDADDVMGNQAEFDYDVAAKDIYLSVFFRAKLFIIPKKLFLMPAKLGTCLIQQKVSVLIWSVAAVRFMAQSGCIHKYGSQFKIKQVFFSGEVLQKAEIEEWISALPETKYVNLYAPTEVTGNCLYYEIDNKNLPEQLPLGKVFPGMEVLVLDEKNNRAEEGKQGELYVRGPFLSSGYYKNNEKTKEKYIQNPLNYDYIDIVFRTGDIVKIQNNQLYFVGRQDHQIKYMGHRVELYEIEHVFSEITGIEHCCCLLIEQGLVLFYVGKIDDVMAREKMKKCLANYKVPKKLVSCDQFPQSKRGKIDRKEIARIYMEKKNENENT